MGWGSWGWWGGGGGGGGGGEGRGGCVNTVLTNLRTSASTAGLTCAFHHRYKPSANTSASIVAVHRAVHIAHQGNG